MAERLLAAAVGREANERMGGEVRVAVNWRGRKKRKRTSGGARA